MENPTPESEMMNNLQNFYKFKYKSLINIPKLDFLKILRDTKTPSPRKRDRRARPYI